MFNRAAKRGRLFRVAPQTLRTHGVRARDQLRCARAERIGALAQRAEQLRVNATEQHALIALRVVGGLGPRAGRARQ